MAFYHEMGGAALEIFKAPFQDLSALWVLSPILLIWIILIIYFDTHKKEQLGWNTALGNGISLFWITVDMMRHMFSNHFEKFTWSKFVMVLIVLLYGIFIVYISFSHKFSPRVTYSLAYPTPIYYLAFVAIIWTYGGLHFSIWVISDLILIYGLIELITLILRKTLPESPKDAGESSDADSKGGFGDEKSGSDKDDLGDLGGDFGDMKL